LTFFLLTVTIFHVIVTGLNIPREGLAKVWLGRARQKAPAGLFFGKKETASVKQGEKRFSEHEESNSGKEVILMCYNCGCEMPDDEMGSPKAITNKTFGEAAKGAGQTPEEAKKNTLALLKKVLKEK
jgi:hypothetical protein